MTTTKGPYAGDAWTTNGFDPDSMPNDDPLPSLAELAGRGLIFVGLALQFVILVWNGLTIALYMGQGGDMISWLWSIPGVASFATGATILRRKTPVGDDR